MFRFSSNEKLASFPQTSVSFLTFCHFEVTEHFFEVFISLIVVKMAFYVEHLNFTLSLQKKTERCVIHQTVAKVLDRKVCIFGHPDVDLRCDKFFWAEWYFLAVAEKKLIRGV